MRVPSVRAEIAARRECFGRFDLKVVNTIMYHISISIDTALSINFHHKHATGLYFVSPTTVQDYIVHLIHCSVSVSIPSMSINIDRIVIYLQKFIYSSSSHGCAVIHLFPSKPNIED